MKKIRNLLATVMLTASTMASAHTITFDYSGAESAIKLLKMKSISKTDIDLLLSSKPYQMMFKWTQHNFGGKGYKEWQELFYYSLGVDSKKPEYFDSLNGFLKTYFERMPGEIRALRDNPTKTENNINYLKSNLNNERIIQQATAFVGDNVQPLDFTTYFICGLGQAVAYDNFTCIDAAVMIKDSSLTESGIAHEMYHCFRNNLSFKQRNKERAHDRLWQLLYWLEDEGIAEMTGDSTFSKHSEIAKLYKIEHPELTDRINQHLAIYDKADDYLKKFNAYIKERVNDNKKFEDMERVFQNMESHQIGHKMAFCIFSNLGSSVLKKCSGKPKDFLLTYQKAALKSGSKYFMFDQDVIDFIETLATN